MGDTRTQDFLYVASGLAYYCRWMTTLSSLISSTGVGVCASVPLLSSKLCTKSWGRSFGSLARDVYFILGLVKGAVALDGSLWFCYLAWVTRKVEFYWIPGVVMEEENGLGPLLRLEAFVYLHYYLWPISRTWKKRMGLGLWDLVCWCWLPTIRCRDAAIGFGPLFACLIHSPLFIGHEMGWWLSLHFE